MMPLVLFILCEQIYLEVVYYGENEHYFNIFLRWLFIHRITLQIYEISLEKQGRF